MKYVFLGNFSLLRPDIAVRRTKILAEIIQGRRSTLEEKAKMGIGDIKQIEYIEKFLDDLEFWIIMSREEEKRVVLDSLPTLKIRVFSLDEINSDPEVF